MPDHVHIVLKPLEFKRNEFYNLSEINHSIKSYSANEINKLENQKKRIVWQHESWDRIIRNEEELLEKMNYILNNPIKRGLVENGYEYKWYYQVGQASLLVEDNNKKIFDVNQQECYSSGQSGMIDLPSLEIVGQASLLVNENHLNQNEQTGHLSGQSGMIDLPLNERLRQLLSYTDEKHLFNDVETNIIINAIDNLKILDPACGSGAFPMGILHKLVHILHKIDPDNHIWKQKLIDRTPQEIREETRIALENKPLDYIRKLGLIESCIYGIDIQPIAIQISKLRFFISLIVEQKIDDSKKNRDIKPLPNLETKFVAANTLIALEKDDGFKTPDVENAENELFKFRKDIFYPILFIKKTIKIGYIRLKYLTIN